MACATLVWALVAHDFSVRYVAENGARAVPLFYTVASLWAALEGSLLLWLLVLTGLTVVAMRTVQPRAVALHPWAMAVLGGIAVFFFALALFAGNAFEVVWPVPADGPGPNPLLQDHPLMAVHPPLLYLGYVGVSVPFAYAVAALVTGQTGRGWLLVTRRWTLASWSFLTLGIVMGAWWSYEVLGWGGYWAWDPVENASILPWFTATALLHSVMVQERRPMLRVWNLALAAATFLLVLVGTFLTRSGVVASVHAFTQSAVGPVLLGFLVAVGVGVGALFVWRADRLGPEERLDAPVSREAVFLGNNVVLVGLAFTVLVGTVFPLVVEAVNGQRLSVGAPYFNRMAVPLALAMVLLMGVGPLVPWGAGDPRVLARRLAAPAAVGAATVAVLGLGGLTGVAPLLTFGLAAFVLATIVGQFAAGARAARSATGQGWTRGLATAVTRRRRLYGGLVVHAGVVLAAVAIAASSAYGVEGEQHLDIGESFAVGPYTATLLDVATERTPRLMAVQAQVRLAAGDRVLAVHEPALSFYPSMSQAIGTPSVESGPLADAYLTISSVDDDRRGAVIRLAVNPMVLWLWVAGGVMLTGALLAGAPSWRRTPTRASAAPEPRAKVPA
ncbi:MAG: heme lyase CcmF/NrfE family subunit [Euzebyales bacterium]|nr:heme lyase CcmF/NrfE family subunit [Euzebyales bacterium]